MRKRRIYTPSLKFKIVIEAIEKSDMAIVARRYGVGASLLTKWKQTLMDAGHMVFETKPNKEIEQLKGQVTRLEQMIGQREVELSLLKNFTDFYAFPNTS
jgi:transposase